MNQDTINSSVDESSGLNNGMIYPIYAIRALSKALASQRFLAYSSEVGESFRNVIPQKVLKTLYGLSILYVGADTFEKTHNFYNINKNKKNTIIYATDLLMWHTMASMVFPAITIHTIVKQSNNLLTKSKLHFDFIKKNPKLGLYIPVVVGLISVPFIIHPIDHFTDFLMNNSIRKLYHEYIKDNNKNEKQF